MSRFSIALLSMLLLGSIAPAAEQTTVGRPLPYFSSKDLTPYWPSEAVKENATNVPAQVTSFAVVDQNGKAVSEKNFSNQISLVNFFFATCPGICPTMVLDIQSFLRKYPDSSKSVQIYSFSVEPENDVPKVLRNYVKTHHIDASRWTLLTGKRDEVFHVGKDMFQADASRGPKRTRSNFIHTRNIYLVDKELRIRGIYDTGKPEAMDLLSADLETLKKLN